MVLGAMPIKKLRLFFNQGLETRSIVFVICSCIKRSLCTVCNVYFKTRWVRNQPEFRVRVSGFTNGAVIQNETTSAPTPTLFAHESEKTLLL